MEADTAKFVDTLGKHALVLGLTARYSGYFAGVDFEKHTLGVLSTFGLSMGVEANERVVFEDMPEHRGNKPVYRGGVLFCNGERGTPVTKPQVLAAYLKSQAIDVKRIVVVDDTKKHLEDFEVFVSREMPGVEFLGFYYQKSMRDLPRECTEVEFQEYMHRLIQIITPTAMGN
jgi:histidinol phosphatase-like enzyme